jgi:Protein of unknown function (DUF2865)
MMLGLFRRFGPVVIVLAVATIGGGQAPPQAPPPPAAQSANPACVRLETTLANLDRGNGEAARAEQTRRYEEAAQRQQRELDRVQAQSQRMGCTGSGFFLFGGGQPPQCDRLNNQMQTMRANLDRINMGLQQMEGNHSVSDAQRQQVLAQLAQNNCGPQYRTAAPAGPGGVLDALFGNNTSNPAPPEANAPPSGTYRTVCVRTCDGYFFPVSYATVPSKFPDDERSCQRLCPAAEVALYSYRNPGEDMSQAVSTGGRRYSELPTAFRYRQEFNPSCTCKQAGQSWSDAVKQGDDPVERGDIVVTPDKARILSQPKADPPAKGGKQNPRNAKTDPKAPPAAAADPTPEPAPPPATADTATPPDGKRTIRIVGPQPTTPAR